MSTIRRVTFQTSESIDSREMYLEKLGKMLEERPIKIKEIRNMTAEQDNTIVGLQFDRIM